MSRLTSIARRGRYRKPPSQERQLPAIDVYRDRLDHLADAGGAYLVLPYGLLDQLSAEQQLQVIDIVKELARTNPTWASNTTYQVLHWVRVHPADLSTEELTWHDITSDIDPTTGTVAYSRGGKPLPPETTVGHRPAPDATPAPPGTHPGARPALLPAAPGSILTGIAPETSQGLRTDRAKRVIETRRRREVLFQRAPNADPQWAEAIIAAGVALKTTGSVLENVIDREPFFSDTLRINFDVGGLPDKEAGYVWMTRTEAEAVELRQHSIPGEDGKLMRKKDQTASYTGEVPYITIALDGRERPTLHNFAPTLATAPHGARCVCQDGAWRGPRRVMSRSSSPPPTRFFGPGRPTTRSR